MTDEIPQPLPLEVQQALIQNAAELSIAMTQQVALIEILKMLPNDQKKAVLLKELAKRLLSCNKAFAAALEGYAT